MPRQVWRPVEFVAELRYGNRLARPYFFDLVLPLSWPSPTDFARARFRKRWTAFIAMLMAERRAAGKNEGAPPRDLFDLMVAARDPETNDAFSEAAIEGLLWQVAAEMGRGVAGASVASSAIVRRVRTSAPVRPCSASRARLAILNRQSRRR